MWVLSFLRQLKNNVTVRENFCRWNFTIKNNITSVNAPKAILFNSIFCNFIAFDKTGYWKKSTLKTIKNIVIKEIAIVIKEISDFII